MEIIAKYLLKCQQLLFVARVWDMIPFNWINKIQGDRYMNNLIRFALITIVIVVAALLLLAVGGVLSSRELQDNVVKVLQVVAIVFGASALITLVTKK